jgi:hypothetical protein
MATINVSTTVSIDSRGEAMTVGEALDYIVNLKQSTGEDGEEQSLTKSEAAALAIVYAARRMRALATDQKRYNAGKAPARVYVPRVDKVKGARKVATKHRAESKDLLAKDLGIAAKDAARAARS